MANIVELKNFFIDNMECYLPQEFIDKAIVSFCNRHRSRVAAAGEHSENPV